jgi:hypothetical protein
MTHILPFAKSRKADRKWGVSCLGLRCYRDPARTRFTRVASDPAQNTFPPDSSWRFYLAKNYRLQVT